LNETESTTRASAIEPASVRTHAALMGIYEISKVLTRPARLETALAGVVNLLHSFMDMSGGLIALLDEEDLTTTVVGADGTRPRRENTLNGCRSRPWGRLWSPGCRWWCAMWRGAAVRGVERAEGRGCGGGAVVCGGADQG